MYKFLIKKLCCYILSAYLIDTISSVIVKNKEYDKRLIDAIIGQEPRLSKKYLKEIYRYTFIEKIPFNEVRDLFAKIDELNLHIQNINLLSYTVLKQAVDELYQSIKGVNV